MKVYTVITEDRGELPSCMWSTDPDSIADIVIGYSHSGKEPYIAEVEYNKGLFISSNCEFLELNGEIATDQVRILRWPDEVKEFLREQTGYGESYIRMLEA